MGGVIFGGDLINNVENQPEDDSTSSDVQTHLLTHLILQHLLASSFLFYFLKKIMSF